MPVTCRTRAALLVVKCVTPVAAAPLLFLATTVTV